MSDSIKNTKHGSAIGVIKFPYKKAGYPDILKIANEWCKDPNFYQVIVRKVSESDFGIQFIYYTDKLDGKSLSSDFEEKYLSKLRPILYAYDIAYGSGKTKEEALEGVLKNIDIK